MGLICVTRRIPEPGLEVLRDSGAEVTVLQSDEEAGVDRDRMMSELKARNVGTGLHFRAVHTQPYYADKYPQWPGRLPAAEWASERICSLPLFPDMTEEDVEYVVAAIKDVLAAAR